jgi:SAM-dependent methyltransferase
VSQRETALTSEADPGFDSTVGCARRSEGFDGGSPAFWEGYMADAEVYDGRRFRSAPDRALLEAALTFTGLGQSETVVELGCGSSSFLSRIALATGARVAGVDFAPESLARTKATLRRLGVDESALALGTIDDFVAEHEGEFDVVLSFGLIEHFADLEAIVAAHFRCARPGARIFIAAPNLAHVNLAWIRLVAPSLLKWHRPLDLADVKLRVRSCGGVDLQADYLGGVRLFANPERPNGRRSLRFVTGQIVRKGVNGLGELTYRLAPATATRLAGARLSPFFAVCASKPESPVRVSAVTTSA